MAEIVWESDAQMSGFTIISNGMVWPDDWPGTLVEAQFTSARGDGADLDRDPDMVPSGPGRVTFTPLVRTVGYDGEHGKRIVSLHPFEAVVGDDGYLYTPDEYGQPGIRGIVLPSNNSDVVDEHDWTWRVTFDIPDTTIRPTHIPTPHDHSVDIKDYLDSDANYGVRVVVDRVAARETLTARDETIAARDEVLPARDETLTARDETLAHGITVDTSVGTRVFVGDTMIYGDTGWRDIRDMLHEEWELNDSAGHFEIARTNNVVTISMRIQRTDDSPTRTLSYSNLDLLSTSSSSLPQGFRPKPNYGPYAFGGTKNGYALVLSSHGNMRNLRLFAADTPDSEEWRPGDSHTVVSSWTTYDAWPTSLPGTPD